MAAFAAEASVIMTDDFPCSFLPHVVKAAAARVDVRLEVVDSNGLVPLVSCAALQSGSCVAAASNCFFE